jgi:hypothetical protein
MDADVDHPLESRVHSRVGLMAEIGYHCLHQRMNSHQQNNLADDLRLHDDDQLDGMDDRPAYRDEVSRDFGRGMSDMHWERDNTDRISVEDAIDNQDCSQNGIPSTLDSPLNMVQTDYMNRLAQLLDCWRLDWV